MQKRLEWYAHIQQGCDMGASGRPQRVSSAGHYPGFCVTHSRVDQRSWVKREAGAGPIVSLLLFRGFVVVVVNGCIYPTTTTTNVVHSCTCAQLAPGQSFVWNAPKFRSQRNLGGMGPNFAEFRSNRAQISRNKVVKIANETLAWGNARPVRG